MRCWCRIWFPLAVALFFGILAGMLFPPVMLLVVEGILLGFILLCWLCY